MDPRRDTAESIRIPQRFVHRETVQRIRNEHENFPRFVEQYERVRQEYVRERDIGTGYEMTYTVVANDTRAGNIDPRTYQMGYWTHPVSFNTQRPTQPSDYGEHRVIKQEMNQLYAEEVRKYNRCLRLKFTDSLSNENYLNFVRLVTNDYEAAARKLQTKRRDNTYWQQQLLELINQNRLANITAEANGTRPDLGTWDVPAWEVGKYSGDGAYYGRRKFEPRTASY